MHIHLYICVHYCHVEDKGWISLLPCKGGPVGEVTAFPRDLDSVGGATASWESLFDIFGTTVITEGSVVFVGNFSKRESDDVAKNDCRTS